MGDILRAYDGDLAPLKYLIVWLGTVGVAVGLSLPKDMFVKVGSQLRSDFEGQVDEDGNAPRFIFRTQPSDEKSFSEQLDLTNS